MTSFVTRFAPSPTGLLHLGHAYSALSAFTAAQAAGGRMIVRIEDIDTTRCRPWFEAAILEDLAWLGLSWPQPVRRQSEHLLDYRAALHRLHELGLLYRCFRTRREVLEDIARAPHTPGKDLKGAAHRGGPLSREVENRLLAQGRPFAWRLSLTRAEAVLGGFAGLQFEAEDDGSATNSRTTPVELSGEGDVVLARKDVGVAYHLAVVVDDALQGVSHVIRGEDLLSATHIQVLLQKLLGLPTPIYRHHKLLLDADGERLAKRNGASSLRDLRAAGVDAAEVRAQLGFGDVRHPSSQ